MIYIISKIKTVCRRKLFYPVILALFVTLCLIICPFISIFHPEYTNNILEINQADEYMRIKADTLYYTGYNLSKPGSNNYGYYYSITDNKCVFAIIKYEGTPQSVLEDYEFTAKIIKPDSAYKNMLSQFVNDLNWNIAELNEINNNFVVSEADYNPTFYVILLWILLVILLICVKKIVSCLCELANPYIYPVCTFLGKKEQKELIDAAQQELSTENYIQINNMYITENYFIDLDKSKVSIIPLNEIVWCYRLGSFSFNPKNTSPEFSICFMISSGAVIYARHKSSDEALELINAIRATGYKIIIGHSESKRKEAKRLISQYDKTK